MVVVGGRGRAALLAVMISGALVSTAHAQEAPEPSVEPAAEAPRRGMRIRGGLTGGLSFGGAEARREGGFMVGGTVHARFGVQFTDIFAIYYEAAGYFGGMPRNCERAPTRNCEDYGMALHSSAGMLELTFDWFQIGGGGGVIGGVVAGHPTSGLVARGRIAYVDGWDRPHRAGFTVGAEIMAAALFDGCWAHTTEVTVGYEWY